MADAVSSGSCPILFNVLTLNVAICIVLLHFSKFCLSSVADFSNTEARAPTSAGRTLFFYPREERVVWAWVMLIFRWLFLFSFTQATLVDEQQSFPNRTIWSWPLNHRIQMHRTWLGFVLSRQRVYLLTFTSTITLPMIFENKNIYFTPSASLSSPFYLY